MEVVFDTISSLFPGMKLDLSTIMIGLVLLACLTTAFDWIQKALGMSFRPAPAAGPAVTASKAYASGAAVRQIADARALKTMSRQNRKAYKNLELEAINHVPNPRNRPFIVDYDETINRDDLEMEAHVENTSRPFSVDYDDEGFGKLEMDHDRNKDDWHV